MGEHSKKLLSGITLFAAVTACLTGAVSVHGQQLDEYGGWTGLQGHNTSGYFRVEKINGRYWLITPDNNVFWSVGNCVTQYYDTWGGLSPALGYCSNPLGNKAKYNGSVEAWIDAVKSRDAAWHFNTSAAWGRADISGIAECVTVLGMTDRARALGCTMVNVNFADVFDPKFAQACDERAKTLASRAEDPWRIGSFPDNELWWSHAYAPARCLPDQFIALPPTAYGKQYWVETFLKGKYAAIGDLNAAWGTGFTDWTGTGNTVINATAVDDDANYPARLNDKVDFVEAIADQYYRLATGKMRQYDPNHIVFSTRWAMWYDGYANPYTRPFNERIWKKAGQYCDVFANNGYVDFGYAETNFQHSSRVFMNAKKPFMITEHSYLANDSYFRDNPGWLPTQMDRAVSHADHLKTVLDLGVGVDPNDGQPAKTCMGIHWFQYYDEPSLGRPDGEAAQFGLLTAEDEAFTPLVDVMATVHDEIYDYAASGTPFVIPPAPTAVKPVTASMQTAEKASSFEHAYFPDDGAWGHSAGTLVDDPESSKGKAWKGTAGTGNGTYIQYGPYTTGTLLWPSCSCTIRFRLKTSDNTTANVVAAVDAVTNYGGTSYANRQIKGTDFAAPNTYQEFSITFTTPAAPVPDKWEYRVLFGGSTDIWIDTTTVSITPPVGYVAGPISDTSASTVWWSAGHTSPDSFEWAAVDLGSSKSGITTAALIPGAPTASGMPVDFRLEYSQDGAAWSPISGQSYTGFANNGSPLYVTFGPLTARYIRVYATKLGIDTAGKYRLQLAGIDIPLMTGTATPTFEWTAVPDAVSYTVLYSPEPAFPDEQTIRVDGVTGTTYTPTIPLPPGVWYWTVRAVDAEDRGGYYLKTVKFSAGDYPETQVDPILNLRCEQITAWPMVDNTHTGGDGTAWVFRDTSRKAEGESSARVVFTVNSLNKITNQKNTGASSIRFEWAGPRMDYSAVSAFTFKLYPQRFADTSAAIISPAKYLHLKMIDSEGGTVVDVPVDPTRTLPSDTWSTVSIPLGNAERSHVSDIIFYINCGDTNLTWNERMVFNIDDIVQGVPRDTTPPSTPSVTDVGPFSLPVDTLAANWTSEDPESGVNEYKYTLGTTPGGSEIIPWTPVGMETSVTCTGLSTALGSTYYFSVMAGNGERLWSSAGISPGTTIVSTLDLGNVHNNPNGAKVTVPYAIVTAGTDQLYRLFYVEALDRSSGLLAYTTSNVSQGDLVGLSGYITTQWGERELWSPTITTFASGKPIPTPLYMNEGSLGGQSPNQYTLQLYQGVGCYNVGLLVKVSGWVTGVDTTNKFFYVDDGSGRTDPVGYRGIRVYLGSLAQGNVIPMPPENSYVEVTGLSSVIQLSSKFVSLIRPRSAADVVVR